MKGLLFITHQTNRYDYLQSVELALLGGCKQIQLRMKDAAIEEVKKTAIKAKAMCDAYGAELYINDYVSVCRKVKATGVHLGKADMSPSEARSILGDSFIIGGTANTFVDILFLSEQGVDYVGLGPFRYTKTKEKLSPVLGLSGYSDVLDFCKMKGIDIPIIAVGGITLADVPDLLQTGIAGFAVSSAILDAENPVEETMRFLANCYE